MKQLSKFLHEVKLELSRVEWPRFQEFVGAALVTLIVVIAFAIFLGIVDKLISVVAKHIFDYSR
jgi:preprotein translocase subunit SecE